MSRRLLILVASVLVCVHLPAFAQAPTDAGRLVAILPVVAKGAVDRTDLGTLDDTVRSEAARHLTGAGYIVLTDDVQIQVLEDNAIDLEKVIEACESGCPLAVAKELKARLFITGQLTRESDGQFVFFVRFYDGNTGALLSGTSNLEGASVREVRRAFSDRAEAFLARGLSQVDSELQFGAVDVRVPVVKVDASAGGMSQINIDVETALDDAMAVEKDPRASPEEKASAWCRLAGIGDRNAYLESAASACSSWREYASNLRRAERSMTDHYRVLTRYLQLRFKSAEQKAMAVDAFIAAYSGMAEYPMVKEVTSVRSAVAAGKPVALAELHSADDSDGDGISDRADRCPLTPGLREYDGCETPVNHRVGQFAWKVWKKHFLPESTSAKPYMGLSIVGWEGLTDGVLGGGAFFQGGQRWGFFELDGGGTAFANIATLRSTERWSEDDEVFYTGDLIRQMGFLNFVGTARLHVLSAWPSLLNFSVGARARVTLVGLIFAATDMPFIAGDLRAVLANDFELSRTMFLRVELEFPVAGFSPTHSLEMTPAAAVFIGWR